MCFTDSFNILNFNFYLFSYSYDDTTLNRNNLSLAPNNTFSTLGRPNRSQHNNLANNNHHSTLNRNHRYHADLPITNPIFKRWGIILKIIFLKKLFNWKFLMNIFKFSLKKMQTPKFRNAQLWIKWQRLFRRKWRQASNWSLCTLGLSIQHWSIRARNNNWAVNLIHYKFYYSNPLKINKIVIK